MSRETRSTIVDWLFIAFMGSCLTLAWAFAGFGLYVWLTTP